MSRKIIITTLALISALSLTITSCITIAPQPESSPPSNPEPIVPAAPTSPTTPSFPESTLPTTPTTENTTSLPDSPEDMTDEDLDNQITVLECPDEAQVGEYITVKIQLPNDTPIPDTIEAEDYLLRIRDEFPPDEQQTSVISVVYNLGYAIPDENLVLCWHVQIPTDSSFEPGNYKLEITQEGSSTTPAPVHPSSPPGYQEGTYLHYGNLLERNIIIKE